MSGRPLSHDRVPAIADRDATLSGTLARLRLQGAIFLRGEYTEAWAYDSLPPRDAVAVLAPGAERMILFHVIASGKAWIETYDSERHWAGAGDVIVLPYGDGHRMGGTEPAELVPVDELIDSPPWERMPVIRHGGEGAATHVVCGYLTCDHPLFDPRLQALPPVFVVRPPEGPARDWVRASISYAIQQTELVADDRFEAPTKVPELLLVEVIKLHLATTPADKTGWLHALRDPVLAPVLAAIHAAPERRWNLLSLAKEASVSVSLLDERFREELGLAPIRYLSGWRMHLAKDLLHSSDLGVAAVAHRIGYES
ncbi:MAG TPA: AraC family transcriptional regulator, partial [Propionibacteriaceae bacterium]|nr:AraC family transcriptional regulator [Propionibacteriaceae bacterium]